MRCTTIVSLLSISYILVACDSPPVTDAAPPDTDDGVHDGEQPSDVDVDDSKPGAGTGDDAGTDSGAGTGDNEFGVGNRDPFVRELDYVRSWASEESLGVVGYDARGQEIGRLSAVWLNADALRITHEYARPCDPAVEPMELECKDIWDAIVPLTANSEMDVLEQTLPGNVLIQRAEALRLTIDANTPQADVRDHVKCALFVLAPIPACFATAGLAVLTCPASVLTAVCSCSSSLKKTKFFKNYNFDRVCKPT
ncbi:MAG: hypothetical protein R6X02_20010 [Enhygromyxa sp.]